MQERLNKIIVGLALVCDLSNRRHTQKLLDLYRNPTGEGIRALHSQFKDSESHYDREISIWLSLALDLQPQELDMEDLLLELREMEGLLYIPLREPGIDATMKQDLNKLINYIVNAAQSLEGGWYIDAKILLNSALEYSHNESIEKLKTNSFYRNLIGLLQIEILRRYNQIRDLPAKLIISEQRTKIVIEVQEMLIEIMSTNYLQHEEKPVFNVAKYLTSRLMTSLRYLIRSDIPFEKTLNELAMASEFLKEQKGKLSDKAAEDLAQKIDEKICALLPLS